ncbi:MAG TPA: putative porin [Opitutaceae bacterium]
MATSLFTRLALIGALALGAATAARAQDSGPLIDLLVKKGLVSDQEAEELRTELLKEFAVNSPAGKLDLSSRVQRFTLAGDVRVRYQYDNEVTNFSPASVGPNNDRSRYRYRFRFGPTVLLANNWTLGLRLETANGATSTNDDFGAAGSTNFAKDGNTAYVGQAYIQYLETNAFGGAIDRFDVRIGKHAHPFYSNGVNGFVFDTDLNFEGLSEELYFMDVGAPGWALSLRAGQYILAANSRTTDRTGGFLNDPSLMWVAQAEYAKLYTYENNVYGIRIAPMVVAFTAPEVTGSTITSDANFYDDLLSIIVPAEYTFLVNNNPFTVYGTYGYNLKGGDRANRLYSTSGTTLNLNGPSGNPDNYAQMFNFGLRYGGARNPGDLQLTAEYRYVEPGAYTAILLDSDFAAGRTNGAGGIFSASYMITDAVTATTTYFHAENIDKNSPATVGFHKADVLQVDLSARF